MAGVAVIAGADTGTAAVLGVSMTALQVSIGTVNDIVDAPRDAVSKPRKPIPAGVVPRGVAAALAVAGGGVGLGLGLATAPAVAAIGLAVLAIGYGYDLVFKGTAWSWLPFAVGIPLLPVYGWVGATGVVPRSFAVLIPVAVVAGAALAIANARADEVRDRAAGTVSVATELGGRRSWLVSAALLVVVVGAAVATLLVAGAGPSSLAMAGASAVLIAVGLGLGRSGDARRLERAWEVQAVGVALLAAGWLAGVPLD